MSQPATFPGKIKPYTLANIVRIHGCGNYSLLYMTDGRQLLLSYTLKRYVESLPDFVRSHKSHLVNPKFVKRVAIYGPTVLVLMKSGEEIPVSRRQVDEVLERFNYAEQKS